MKFIFCPAGDPFPQAQPRCILMRGDNWDDYGFQISFMAYCAPMKSDLSWRVIGPVKILQEKSEGGEGPIEILQRTHLPSTFERLPPSFISLGQNQSYYKKIDEYFDIESDAILRSLRDIAVSPGLAPRFEPTTAFRNSLMRENTAQRARRFGYLWSMGEDPRVELDFTYSGEIEGAESPVTAYFDFNPRDELPGRIVGIIGRNAVGKTQYLANLGADLALTSRTSAKSWAERDARFHNERPLFTRVIAISYSAFDKFRRPPPNERNSYIYCGIRTESGGLSRRLLTENYLKNWERIYERDLIFEWRECLAEVFESEGEEIPAAVKAALIATEENAHSDALSIMSSGQSILAHFITALLAWIEEDSIVLFDEPETHLHPNAVASLFVVLNKILKKHDSFSVIATHSPLVIQEIPAKRVLVFKRKGSVTEAQPLAMESFGESISELTKHVFETIEIESLYRKTLRALAKKAPIEEVIEKFPLGLSLNAEAYLFAQYKKKIE